MNSDPRSNSSEPSNKRAVQVDAALPRKGWRFVLWLLIVAILCTGLYLGWRRTGPDPPQPNLDGLDPAIVDVLEKCAQLVRQNPRSGDAWGQLGTAFLIYEFESEAQMCFDHAERFDPSDVRWPYFHGVSLFPQKTEESLENLRRAVDLDKQDTYAPRLRLANILSELGQYDEAEEHYLAIIEHRPNHPGAVFGLGRLAFARGEFQQSLEFLNQAATSAYTAKASHQLLITVYNRLGNEKLAAQLQMRLSQLPVDEPLPDPLVDEASKLRTGLRAWVDHGGKLVRQGNIKQAKPFAELAVKKYPESAEAWMLMAQIHLAEKKSDDALMAAQRAVEISPHAVEPQVQLGVTLMYRQQMDDAIISLQRAIELNPELSQAHHNLGLCYSNQRAWANADSCFQAAIRLNPGFVDSYLGLAESQVQQGDKMRARESLEKVMRLRPGDPRALQILNKYELGTLKHSQ